MDKQRCAKGRDWLKEYARDQVDWQETDQAQGIAAPPAEAEKKGTGQVYTLPDIAQCAGAVQVNDVLEVIEGRRSTRRFAPHALSLAQMSVLAWAAAGYRQPIGKKMRHVPSAGNRQPWELYAVLLDSREMASGVYRYSPSRHALLQLSPGTPALRALSRLAAREQPFAGTCSCNFILTLVPSRSEWRYDYTAHKVMALDSGHLMQNLCLAAQALGLSSCCVAAYDQDAADRLVMADGREEFTVYMCPVGYPQP